MSAESSSIVAGLHRLVLLVLCGLGALGLSGCASLTNMHKADEPEPVYIVKEITCRSERILDEITRLALAKQGYPGQRGLEQDLSIETLWQNHLGTRRGEGFRLQAFVRYSPLGADRYEVSVRVRRQINQSIARPTDLSYAEWEWVPDDERAAGILAQLIVSYFADENAPG
jgi:hypothetical protein